MRVDEENYKVVFIISHYYCRGYRSFLKIYIDNINTYYTDSLIIVVDNKSVYKDDIFNELKSIPNVIFLDNNTDCKFEIGAYKTGIKYLLDNNIITNYQYFVLTQDTFFLNKKYDFNNFKINKINASSIVGLKNDWERNDIWSPILEKLNLLTELEKAQLCWCNSLCVNNIKINNFYDFIKDILVTTRYQSEASERYLGRMIYELNESNNFAIDGTDENYYIDNIRYDCLNLPDYKHVNKYFVKFCQQKNEGTKDK